MGKFAIVLIALLLFVISIVFIYNSLISKRNQVKNIRAGVDAQLKKRYDLIPNLVASVKEYLLDEKATLKRITELRNQAIRSSKDEDTFALNNELSSLLSNIKVTLEAYPDLKANENVMHLQKTLNEVESQISVARRAYNGSVMEYNNTIELFPSNIIANLFSFKKEKFF